MTELREYYLSGVSVSELSEKYKKSRTTIYNNLEESGVNLAAVRVLTQRKPSPVSNWLDFEWTPEVGKKPKKIAELTGFNYNTLVNTLRKRRDYLEKKILALLQYFPWVTGYYLDPYSMEVTIFFRGKKGKGKQKVLKESQIIALLKKQLLSS